MNTLLNFFGIFDGKSSERAANLISGLIDK